MENDRLTYTVAPVGVVRSDIETPILRAGEYHSTGMDGTALPGNGG